MPETRRTFLQAGLAIAAAQGQTAQSKLPWYRRFYRWGQADITERDPLRLLVSSAPRPFSGRRLKSP